MGRRVSFCVLASFILSGGSAHADLTSVGWTRFQPQIHAIRPDLEVLTTGLIFDAGCFSFAGSEGGFVADQSPAPVSPDHQAFVTSIPPAPDSASLFLCAMGTVGAWQITRTLRRVQFTAVPDWMDAGGPNQIGRATVLDIGLAAGPPRFHEQPSPFPVSGRIDVELLSPLRSQCLLTTTASRAPPSLL